MSRARLGAVVLALGALAACGGNSSPAASPSPSGAPSGPSSSGATPSPAVSAGQDNRLFETFDNNDNDWPMRTDPDGTKLAVTHGEYQVTLTAGSIRYIRPAALAQRQDVRSGVSVTAKVQVLEGEQYAFGIGCRMNPSDKQYYVGRLFQDGTSAIIRRAKGQPERILRASRADPLDINPGRPIQLVLFCGTKDGEMDLTLTVNGDVVVQAADRQPLPENPPGIYVVAGLKTPTSSFAYDDILVSPYTPE